MVSARLFALIDTANGFGGECYLDARLVRSAVPRPPLSDLDLVTIENVGNLVCPPNSRSVSTRAMVYSVTEAKRSR